ncbi:Hypothetical protein CAP_1100 [Chondromyces apiculatus DSM 436]|uniref:Uncharacterized protein n=1 Tax=Chondromyces apiculatus DSM 436 TaxID=1192034 RepID=A0A017SUA3_9BACT|nr:Hypothetical protein CAP_1100 [Chondromyces apiculatus DSM 436]
MLHHCDQNGTCPARRASEDLRRSRQRVEVCEACRGLSTCGDVWARVPPRGAAFSARHGGVVETRRGAHRRVCRRRVPAG